MTGAIIRDATDLDAAACAEIYAHYVHETAITFENEPPTVAEMAGRIAEAQRGHAWLVLLDGSDSGGGRIAGYAYGHEFKSRAAYRWSCEVSVYLEAGRRRTGAGRALYGELLPRLVRRGFRTAVAGITLPNAASVGLHEALGFEPVGTYRRIGWKFDSWHDVLFTQLALSAAPDPPAELV
jgi:phosphinothricin acetyltransferase